MIRESITVDEAIDFLNELVDADPEAVRRLIMNRVACNSAVADHPTAQVSLRSVGSYEIGLLGVVNGLFGCNDEGWGAVAAVVDVVCSKQCGRPSGPGQSEGDTCTGCGASLTLGDVLRFQRALKTATIIERRRDETGSE